MRSTKRRRRPQTPRARTGRSGPCWPLRNVALATRSAVAVKPLGCRDSVPHPRPCPALSGPSVNISGVNDASQVLECWGPPHSTGVRSAVTGAMSTVIRSCCCPPRRLSINHRHAEENLAAGRVNPGPAKRLRSWRQGAGLPAPRGPGLSQKRGATDGVSQNERRRSLTPDGRIEAPAGPARAEG